MATPGINISTGDGEGAAQVLKTDNAWEAQRLQGAQQRLKNAHYTQQAKQAQDKLDEQLKEKRSNAITDHLKDIQMPTGLAPVMQQAAMVDANNFRQWTTDNIDKILKDKNYEQQYYDRLAAHKMVSDKYLQISKAGSEAYKINNSPTQGLGNEQILEMYNTKSENPLVKGLFDADPVKKGEALAMWDTAARDAQPYTKTSIDKEVKAGLSHATNYANTFANTQPGQPFVIDGQTYVNSTTNKRFTNDQAKSLVDAWLDDPNKNISYQKMFEGAKALNPTIAEQYGDDMKSWAEDVIASQIVGQSSRTTQKSAGKSEGDAPLENKNWAIKPESMSTPYSVGDTQQGTTAKVKQIPTLNIAYKGNKNDLAELTLDAKMIFNKNGTNLSQKQITGSLLSPQKLDLKNGLGDVWYAKFLAPDPSTANDTEKNKTKFTYYIPLSNVRGQLLNHMENFPEDKFDKALSEAEKSAKEANKSTKDISVKSEGVNKTTPKTFTGTHNNKTLTAPIINTEEEKSALKSGDFYYIQEGQTYKLRQRK